GERRMRPTVILMFAAFLLATAIVARSSVAQTREDERRQPQRSTQRPAAQPAQPAARPAQPAPQRVQPAPRPQPAPRQTFNTQRYSGRRGSVRYAPSRATTTYQQPVTRGSVYQGSRSGISNTNQADLARRESLSRNYNYGRVAAPFGAEQR